MGELLETYVEEGDVGDMCRGWRNVDTRCREWKNVPILREFQRPEMNMEIDTLSERSEEEGDREEVARPKVSTDIVL